MRVQNKSIIVTGAGNGIGEGIAKRLAAEGGKVLVDDNGFPVRPALLGDLRGRGRSAVLCGGSRCSQQHRQHKASAAQRGKSDHGIGPSTQIMVVPDITARLPAPKRIV